MTERSEERATHETRDGLNITTIAQGGKTFFAPPGTTFYFNRSEIPVVVDVGEPRSDDDHPPLVEKGHVLKTMEPIAWLAILTEITEVQAGSSQAPNTWHQGWEDFDH